MTWIWHPKPTRVRQSRQKKDNGGPFEGPAAVAPLVACESSKPVSVSLKGDRLGNGDEWFYVNVTGAAGALTSSGMAYGTILDDEPRLSSNSPSAIKEGNRGTRLLKFTVILSAPND